MDRVRRVGLWLVILIVFATGYGLGLGSSAVWAEGYLQHSGTDVEPFVQALELIQERYVEPVDPAMLVEAALIGMLDTLEDPFSFYMDSDTFQLMNTDLQGHFEGIGATVRQDADTGRLVIVGTMPDSPAEQAGMLSGDAIVSVDGADV
ncbi:MAG: PDZ domain-containing protein, partial [Anaerolineae bacterium]|nr:PDZ domain-containing protein [Anaerolineae bacterium]